MKDRPHFLLRMRDIFLLAATAVASAQASQRPRQPFQPAETASPRAAAAAAAAAVPIALDRRQSQGGCIANFYSCAGQGSAVFNNVCCQYGQTCALDASNNPACCPAGAVCTGTAPATFVTPTAAATTAVSYVPNAYFSFPYVATYFANGGDCSRAVSQCSSNYAACTSQLEGLAGSGGGYAVTIVVPGGGGTTVTGAGQTTYATASATSICNSLSSAACSNLQLGMCTMTGTTASGFYFGTGGANAAARPTPPPVACFGLAGVVAAGVAGFNLAL
ncbi:hypothetical protein QBC46DRAFT_381602 [Diplogelasinospora grovesii]|uniref:Gpi-anchored protein n=1 Tax=Diplogelasinospora grovesii TaxID=303347 RepID=A0AAN6NBR8_9PEZI|nr:hypothetical protein QBC46DRAFT_381602 [Diplogelasinospora grovesii]